MALSRKVHALKAKTGTWLLLILWLEDNIILYYTPQILCHQLDHTLTVENIVGVLKLMKSRWYAKLSHILAVPPSQKMKIKQQYSSEEEQLKAFVEYIHTFHPRMSWDTLAGALHSMEEDEALEELQAKKYLLRKTGVNMYMCMHES